MKRELIRPLLVWAARDSLRRPGESTLLAAAVFALVVTLATPLLLSAALTAAADQLLDRSPALVVRRVGPTGFSPLLQEEALESARKVTGVVRATPRVWGVVTAVKGVVVVEGMEATEGMEVVEEVVVAEWPVTVVGVDGEVESRLQKRGISVPVEAGRALVGPGLAHLTTGDQLRLLGAEQISVTVQGHLPAAVGAVLNDSVLLQPSLARQLLGVPEGYASDLAVEVFHDAEATALLPDLVAAMPWPVSVSTRRQARALFAGGLARRDGVGMLLLLPAGLALLLLLVVAHRDGAGRRWEIGLLRAMGWCSDEIVKLHLLRALLIAAPAAVTGLAVATLLAVWPGSQTIQRLLFEWGATTPPELPFTPALLPVLAEVAALVLIPWCAAVVWTTARACSGDTEALLAGEPPT